jgi:hypothetical protein
MGAVENVVGRKIHRKYKISEMGYNLMNSYLFMDQESKKRQ